MTNALDASKVNAFIGRVVADAATTQHTLLSCLGDRLGLFKAMAGQGPLTSTELAERTGLSERYVREWLGGMAAGEYVIYDPAKGTFHFPPEHAAVLADEDGPMFFGGLLQILSVSGAMIPRVADAFRTGKGIAQEEYPAETVEATERASAPTYRHMLVQALIPVAGVKSKLDAGARVLDVGCGGGRACITMAAAFPEAKVTGYDWHGASIDRAKENARRQGLASRITFEARDCTKLPRDEFDFITVMDVIHDAVDPLGILTAIRNALKSDGTCLVQEFRASAHVHENIHPMGKFFYGSSLFYCLNVSLAHGGEGLGTLMGEPKLRELASKAGFGSVEKLPIEHPAFAFFTLRR